MGQVRDILRQSALELGLIDATARQSDFQRKKQLINNNVKLIKLVKLITRRVDLSQPRR